jgi:Uncharacterized protein conserved in bacteria
VDKKDLFDQITEVTRNTEDLLNKLHETQSAMVEIMEENAELQIENQHLRERLKQATAAESEGTKNTKYGLSKSLQNLEKLYASGYHVCNEFYGKHRQDEEECAFCLTVIYGDR